MKWVLTYIKPLRIRMLKGISVKIIGTLAELFIPFLLSYILENVIETNEVTKILFFGALMVVCAARPTSHIEQKHLTKQQESAFLEYFISNTRY